MQRKFLIKVLDYNNEDFYSSHSTYHKGDSGLDLFVVDDMVIPAGETKMVKLGITCQSRKFLLCPWKWFQNRSFYKYYSYYLFPRSSISKTPLVLHNSIGLIDAGYTGEIMAAMHNFSSEDFVVKRGERYVQLVNGDLSSVKFELVDDLRDTTRGSGGFGSTGVSIGNLENSTIFTKKNKKVRFSQTLPDIPEEEEECETPLENGPIIILAQTNN